MDGIDLILISFAVVPITIFFAIAATWTVLLRHSKIGPSILFKWDVWFPARAGKYLTSEGDRRYTKTFRLCCLLYAADFLVIAGVVGIVFLTGA